MPLTTDSPANTSALVRSLAQRLERGDAGALAKLRRTQRLLPTVPDPSVWALVVPHTGPHPDSQEAGLLTACLWASWHQRYTRPVNGQRDLGQALRAALPPDRRDREFTALANANTATLPRRLTDAVDLLAAAGVAPDWARLNRDILAWHRGERDRVLRRWSTGLYSSFSDHSAPPSADASTDETAEEEQ